MRLASAGRASASRRGFRPQQLLHQAQLVVGVEDGEIGFEPDEFGVAAQSLTPMEWKVPSHGMPSTAPPMRTPMRSFISRAALLVKVTERICDGQALAGGENMGDAGGQHAGLAGAGAREHQQRPVEGLDRLALLGVERGEPRGGRGGHGARGDAARVAGGLQARGEVHRLAPGVIGELGAPDDAGHHRAGRDADAQLNRQPVAGADGAGRGDHLAGELHRGRGVAGHRRRQPGHRHVGVADGLDLLDAMALGGGIEGGEDLVEQRHDTLRPERGGERGEAGDVGEDDRRVVVALGNRAAGALFEALGDLVGHDIVDERVRLRLGGAGQMQGVVYHQKDDAHHRHRRQGVDLVHEGRIGPDDGLMAGKCVPGSEVAGEGHRRDTAGEPDALDAKDDERHRAGAQIVQLDAGLAAQIGDEIEDAGEDDGAEPDACRGRAEAVEQRHARGAQGRGDVAEDERPQQVPAVQGVVQGIGQRGDAGEIAGDVGDDEPAAGLGVVAAGARGDETPGDVRQPRQDRPGQGGSIGCVVDHALSLAGCRAGAHRPIMGALHSEATAVTGT
jgi:hypothetical protein